MNTKLPPDDSITLPEIMRRFPDEKSAIEYFESIRWANGVECPHCGNKDQNKFWKLDANKEKKVRVGLRQCVECKKQFRVTIGTIFEDSHVPLNLWLIAWYLICGAKKGMSALQLKRHLWGDNKGSYKTAWFMAHRIRHAMQDKAFAEPLYGVVEVDETYVGGFNPGGGMKSYENKIPVVSLVERGGDKRSMVMERVTGGNLRAAIAEHTHKAATIMTDDATVYKNVKTMRYHHGVNHTKKQYAMKVPTSSHLVAHTNTVESSFSLLKRGVMGSFHHVSKKHLPLYLAEFDFRWNTRKQTDGQRTVTALGKAQGKRLRMK
ncbi:MAG: IS1595 family transposase [Chthoniobacteraceae bacterium]